MAYELHVWIVSLTLHNNTTSAVVSVKPFEIIYVSDRSLGTIKSNQLRIGELTPNFLLPSSVKHATSLFGPILPPVSVANTCTLCSLLLGGGTVSV